MTAECLGGLVCAPNATITAFAMMPISSCIPAQGDAGHEGGKAEGGATEGGSTEGGSTEGGSTEGGSTEGGATEAGATDAPTGD